MPSSVNTYSGGMNRDITKTKYNPTSYYYLKNFRVVTDKGLSTFSLENEKGTKFNFSFPDVGAVYRIKIIDNTLPANITINSRNIVVSPDYTIQSLYNTLISDLTIAAEISAGEYVIELGVDYIVIATLDQAVSLLCTQGVSSEVWVPASFDLKVIGWGTLRNDVIVFTTPETQANPTNSTGQIWKFSYDEVTEEVKDVSNTGALVPSKHLVYNHNLNFSTYHRIGDEVVCRYENDVTGRVYWTDNYNRLRTINVYDKKPFTQVPDDLDIVSSVNFTKPIIESIGNGFIPIGSVVQYFYRLININGSSTVVSPGSNLIHLGNGDPKTTGYHDYSGAPQGNSNARSVTYRIENLDTDYNIIEHIVVLWEFNGTPLIYKFNEQYIPSTGQVTITHSGNEDYIEISPEEFNTLALGPNKCKSITYKDNRLIAANIRTDRFELNFDARAYRFKSSRFCDLYDQNGNLDYTISGISKTVSQLGGASWTEIPEEADAINKFNKEDDAAWITNQYKYQSDGVTLGGEGPNVKYEFTTFNLEQDNLSYPGKAPFTGKSRFPNLSSSVVELVPGESYDLTSQFRGFKSPLVSSVFTGFARGEIYRFGLVCYSKKGVPSYVKWVGDIKFPEIHEGYPLGSSLGLKVTVDISTIQDQISGIEFVYVKRTNEDMTRIYTGTSLPLELADGNATEHYKGPNKPLYGLISNALGHELFVTGNNALNNYIEINGSTGNTWCVWDRPCNANWSGVTDTHRAFAFLSPSTQHRSLVNLDFKDGDFIIDHGYYDSAMTLYHDFNVGGGHYEYNVYFKTRNFIPKNNVKRFKISNGVVLRTGEYVPSAQFNNSNNGSPFTGASNIVNASYAMTDGSLLPKHEFYPLGIGDYKAIVTLYTSPTEAWFDPSSDMNYNDITPPSNGYVNLSGIVEVDPQGTDESWNTFNDFHWKILTHGRFLANQYGGNSYEARSKNEYISTGFFYPVTETTNPILTGDVFGGDVYQNYWDSEYLQQYNAKLDWYKDTQSRKFGAAVCIPMEGKINTDLQFGNTWAGDRKKTGVMNDYSYHEPGMNSVYLQANDAKQVFVAKDFLTNTEDVRSHMIWASDPKIDGELLDSWRMFRANNFIEVEGIHGQINKVINFKDRVLFYQTRAFGIAQVNEKASVPDTNGNLLVLGSGGVLSDFDYISTETGSFHQFSIIKSGSAVYHFDAYLKKAFSWSGEGTKPLSDIEGMSSFFFHELNGHVIDTDVTLNDIGEPTGIHGVFDQRYNRILWTFQGYSNINPLLPNTTYSPGDIVSYGGGYAVFITEYTTGNSISGIKLTEGVEIYLTNGIDAPYFNNAFTVSYNENIQAFEAFYSFTPKIYLNTGRRIICPSPTTQENIYILDRGNYGAFFEHIPVDSELSIVVNPQGQITKIFNNVEWLSECYDSNGNDVWDDSLYVANFYNDYQNTGNIPLIIGSNVQRRMRTWRMQIPRNQGGNDRIRSPFLISNFKYDNKNNRRLILHDIITHYTLAPL